MLKLNRISHPYRFFWTPPVQPTPSALNSPANTAEKWTLLHVIPTFKYLNESISRLGLPINLDKDIYPHMVTEKRDPT